MPKFYSLICALFLCSIVHSQTTVTINADRDNTIYQESPNNSNGAGQNIFAGTTKDGHRRRALIHFDLSTIPAGATITAASINLFNNKQGDAASGINIYKLNTNWGEGTSNASGQEGSGTAATANDVTWDKSFYPSTAWTAGGNYQATPSATIASVASGANTATGTGLVADVQSFVTTPANNFGWIITGNAETVFESTLRFASKEGTTTTQRPTITVTYQSTLPVELKSFSGSISNKSALLKWETATENNNSFFNIEHSNNNLAFEVIGKQEGAGTSFKASSYSFTHNNIQEGKHYYRLAQHDINGKVKYSKVIMLVTTKGKSTLNVYPNPATDVLNLLGSSSFEGSSYVIASAHGQVVGNGSIKTQGINVSKLTPGHYYLTIVNNEGESFKTSFLKR